MSDMKEFLNDMKELVNNISVPDIGRETTNKEKASNLNPGKKSVYKQNYLEERKPKQTSVTEVVMVDKNVWWKTVKPHSNDLWNPKKRLASGLFVHLLQFMKK